MREQRQTRFAHSNNLTIRLSLKAVGTTVPVMAGRNFSARASCVEVRRECTPDVLSVCFMRTGIHKNFVSPTQQCSSRLQNPTILHPLPQESKFYVTAPIPGKQSNIALVNKFIANPCALYIMR